jgi:hypothetical protein
MTQTWQPYREPLRATLTRTIAIALVVGAVGSIARGGGLERLPLAVLLALWPSFGGHWVELWFLNWLRPRLPGERAVQLAARLAVWFVAGIAIGYGVYITGTMLAGFPRDRWPAWWVGGFAFIGIELVAHLPLQLRGQPSFYNGRG